MGEVGRANGSNGKAAPAGDLLERLVVETADLGRGTRLVVSGEIDMETGPVFAGFLGAAPGAATVEIDMSGVAFMDSTGLRVLIETRRSRPDARIVVTRASKQVVRLFEVTGLSETFGLPAGTTPT